MKIVRSCLILSLIALLGACAGDVTVGPTDLDRYRPTDGSLFLGNGQLQLIGTAFGDQEGTETFAAVAAKGVAEGSMARSSFLLTPNTGDKPLANNRVIVVIGGGNGYTLCDSVPSVGGRVTAGQPFSVTAAACNGTRRLSSTSGRVDRPISGPDDPAILQLFRLMGSELFPPRNPNYENNRFNMWMF